MVRRLLIALICASAFISSAAFAAVNINTASADQLAQLDGIGNVKAEAIVQYRKAHGDFKSVDGLTQVNGIGQKTVAGIRDAASVGNDSSSQQ